MSLVRLKLIPRSWAGGLDQLGFEAGTVSLPAITKYDDPDTGIFFSAANTIDAACGGIRSLQLATLASGVNYLKVSPATSAAALSAGVLLEAAGSSTNVSIQLLPKGTTGAVVMPAGLIATPGITFLADLNTGVWTSAADTLDFSCGAIRALQIATLASGVNYLTLTPATNAAATSAGVLLTAAGTSTNIGIQLVPKGTGQVIVPAGAVGTPSIGILGDLNTGIYQVGADSLGIAANGANVATFASALTTLPVAVQFGAATSAALLHGAGATNQAGAAASATAGNFMSYYLSDTATSGTSRGIYCRLYLGADGAARGDGEAGRFFTTSAGTGGDGIHGAHCSVSLGTNGTATGLACGVRGTAHIKNAAAIGGTWAGAQGEVWSDGSSAALAGTAAMFRGVLGGDTTALDSGVLAFDFDVPAGNLGTGKLGYVNTAATGNHAASLRCRLNGTTYYLYLFPVQA